MSKPDLQIVFLTSIIASLVTIDCIDELQGTEVYKQELKNIGNRFIKELLRYSSKTAGDIWGTEDEALYALMDYIKNVSKKMAVMRSEDIGVVEAFIDRFNDSPDEALEWLGLVKLETAG